MDKTVGQLIYEVTAKLAGGFNVTMSKAESEFGKLSKSADETDKSMNKVAKSSSVLKNALGAIVGAVSVGALASFFKGSVDSALQSQVASEKLANALSNVKTAREGDFELLTKQANALQLVTAYGDEEIKNSQALLATYQLNGREIEQLTPRLLDMASALAQTGEVSGGLEGATLLLGKAVTGGVSALTRYGVTMTEAQKKAFELASGTEKLSILTQILDDNFKGTAETLGRTLTGRLAILRNRFDEVKESIGFALLPTFESLLGSVTDSVKGIDTGSQSFSTFSKVIYQVTNFVVGMGKALYLVVQVLTGVVDTTIQGGKVIFNIFRDMSKGVTDFGKNIGTVGKALGQVLSGDFKEAKETIAGGFKDAFANTTKSFDDFKFNTKGWADTISEQFDSIGDSALKAVDLSGFKPIDEATIKSYRSTKEEAEKLGSSLKASADSANSAKDKMDGLAGKIGDVRDKAVDASNAIGKQLTESLKKFGTEIADNYQETNDKLATIVAEAEQKKKDLQSQIASGGTDTTDLNKQLAEVQKVLDARVGYEQRAQERIDAIKKQASDAGLDPNALGLDTLLAGQKTFEQQIAEQRKLASADEFTRFELEQANKLQLLATNSIAELVILKTKYDKQKEYEADVTAFFNTSARSRQQAVDAFANSAIAKYGEMANALRQVISLQAQIGNAGGASKLPQFHDGGYVDSRGGEVHPGEFVIPADIVKSMPGLISQLDGMRNGQTNNITINAGAGSSADFDSVAQTLAWRLQQR